MLILALLKYAATSPSALATDETVAALGRADDREVQWTLDAGLGPMLFRAVGGTSNLIPHRWQERLLSADLTAQVTHNFKVDAAIEVIDACARVGTQATLLKGIWISHQCYSEGHLRPMKDIDVLIPAESYSSIQSEILRRGFKLGSLHMGDNPHHGTPLYHDHWRVSVELHTDLFPKSSSLCANKLFGQENIEACSIESNFHSRQIRRLTDELQIAYIASSWLNDQTMHGIDPSFVVPLFDAAQLMKSKAPEIDWYRLNCMLDNGPARSSLHVLLTYFARHALYPRRLPDLCAGRRHGIGALELAMIHAAQDRYLLGGLPWTLPFPPPVPGRYNFRHQLQKRSKWLRSPLGRPE